MLSQRSWSPDPALWVPQQVSACFLCLQHGQIAPSAGSASWLWAATSAYGFVVTHNHAVLRHHRKRCNFKEKIVRALMLYPCLSRHARVLGIGVGWSQQSPQKSNQCVFFTSFRKHLHRKHPGGQFWTFKEPSNFQVLRKRSHRQKAKLLKGGTNRHITARIISALAAVSTLERVRRRLQKGPLKKRPIDDTSGNRDTRETGSSRETKNK